MAKKTRFAFRTTDEFKQRIARVAETLGLDQAVVGEAALEAVVAYVEKWGELTIPIQIERGGRERSIPPPKIPPHVHGRRALPAHSPSTPHPEGRPVTEIIGHQRKKASRP